MKNKTVSLLIFLICAMYNTGISSAGPYKGKMILGIVADGLVAYSLPQEKRNGLQFPYFVGYFVMEPNHYPLKFVKVGELDLPTITRLSAFAENKYFLESVMVAENLATVKWDDKDFGTRFSSWLYRYGLHIIDIPSVLDPSEFPPSFSRLCTYDDTATPPEECSNRDWPFRELLIPYKWP